MLKFMPFSDGDNENATRHGQQSTGSFPWPSVHDPQWPSRDGTRQIARMMPRQHVHDLRSTRS
jgi:hypothetical protein